jgi:hypothetical protein
MSGVLMLDMGLLCFLPDDGCLEGAPQKLPRVISITFQLYPFVGP